VIGTRLPSVLLLVECAFLAQTEGRGNPSARRPAPGWSVEIHRAPPIDMPGQVDSNSPADWSDDELYLISSTGSARMSHGIDQFHQSIAQDVHLSLANG
jgi:hypothetical protein